jgi:glycerophosphoryl diester phosphodiesterase
MLLVAHRTPLSAVGCAQLAAAGARVFEVDVQLGRHHVVVSHYLPFGRGGVLQRDNWRLRWHTSGHRDPAVLDVAAVVPDDCRVMLDMKESTPSRREELTAALIETLADRARFVVCGGRPEDLDRMRRAGFTTWRTVQNARELADVLADGSLPDHAVSIRHSLLTGVSLERLHGVVPAVVAWTVNDPRRARGLRDIGADGVTTDRAAVLTALATRGDGE